MCSDDARACCLTPVFPQVCSDTMSSTHVISDGNSSVWSLWRFTTYRTLARRRGLTRSVICRRYRVCPSTVKRNRIVLTWRVDRKNGESEQASTDNVTSQRVRPPEEDRIPVSCLLSAQMCAPPYQLSAERGIPAISCWQVFSSLQYSPTLHLDSSPRPFPTVHKLDGQRWLW